MNCKNCEAVVESKFCPNCGQTTAIHRVTVKHVVHDLLHAFTHADKGFLLLTKRLLIKPGVVAREYLDGKRKSYFNPLSFLVITSAIFGYFAFTSGYFDSAVSGRVSANVEWSPMREAFKLAAHNAGKFLSITMIVPLYSLLTWIFFIRSKRNYAENFVLNSFIFGEASIFRTLIIIPLFLIIPIQPSRITYYLYEIPFLIYTMVAFRQFFQEHIAWIIIKSILIRVLFVVMFFGSLYVFVYMRHIILQQ